MVAIAEAPPAVNAPATIYSSALPVPVIERLAATPTAEPPTATEQTKTQSQSGTTGITRPAGIIFRSSVPQVMERQTNGVTPEIVARAQARDHEAFEAIFNQYQSLIFNLIYRMMGNREDALDLTQDTFLKAYQGLPKTKPGLRVGTWLYRIATNACLDELRHRKVLKWQPWEIFTSTFHPSQASRDNPEKDCLDKENQEEVQQILDKLHPKYRLCLILQEYHELSYDEIADVLDTTRAAVKSLLFRAREEFRVVYARSLRQPQILPKSPIPYAGNKVR